MTPGPLPPPSRHGGDAASIAHALGLDPASMVDLSASMNPFAPAIGRLVSDAIARDRHALTAYPDPSEATYALAHAIGVDPDLLVLTNGGAEAIALVAAEMPVGNIVEPEFSLYRRHLAAVDAAAPRWRSNPSNPMGRLAAATDAAAVWDEAFYPLATGNWTRGDADSWRLGSLTKLWACPGLRLGYVIAPTPDAAGIIGHRQVRWSVNGLALAVVPDLIRQTRLGEWHRGIGELRSELTATLRAIGYETRTTAVNWVLIRQAGLRAALAPYGVVVRDCTSFGLPELHRVALPRPEDLDRVISAFTDVRRR